MLRIGLLKKCRHAAMVSQALKLLLLLLLNNSGKASCLFSSRINSCYSWT